MELLIATSGEAGGSVSPTPALASVRESEARAAARVLGVGAPRFLRLRDGELEARATLTDACADFIREHRADLVLTFDPEQPWATSPHPDHVAIGRAGLSAAGVPVWCYSTAEPHFALDITTTYPRKLAAREEHRSQTADLRRLRADWQRRAEEIGQLCGVQFAEAFRLS